MRIDDICLVVSDVDRSDEFYSTTLGLERRMRNVRFVDFRLGDGARLAMWVEHSIAETVGPSYPVGPGMPFTVTLETSGAATEVFADPDGITIIRNHRLVESTRLAAATLVVSDLARSAAFLETLGFRAVRADARWIEFDGTSMSLTITLDVPSTPAAPSTGRVMLAIELETGPEVDALWAELRGSGLADSGPPRVYEWGSRSVYFVDDDGYIWEIYAWVETPQ
ncbi:hypothetical protein C5B96_12590 [Subtercola sp. Z020]|uniref:VOC family protein n=1 Tax=Subtercola sp. Z020 TaxID=2080582 RepID=UPI000CE8F838|nr:VOC family protein [Subtercola sp. Z020]PPF79547.1 hypothetical protein C5B96_12590 [Subtercola sp. Z020]